MKITIGLDTLDRLKGVADLVSAFRFAQSEIELVHVLERLGQESMPTPEGKRPDLITNFLKMQEEEAHALLGEGSAELNQRGIPCKKTLITGFSGNRIVAHTDASKADLLALGSTGKGPVESVFLGSVGRKALVSSGVSVLINKDSRHRTSGLTVVFASDHSPYMKRCLDTFLSWRPQGIERIVVVTVYPEQLISGMTALMSHMKADVASWVRGALEKENAATVSRLQALTGKCTSRVETGPVGDTLERVMKEENADVLVLGAQGHGFLDRTLIGSTSLDQALRRPYSVLVVRA